MPLPTTGLIRHFDASTNADLYKTYSGGLLQDNPADGEQILAWDDKIDATTGGSQVIMGLEGTTPDVRWRDDSVLKLPSLEILDGTLRMENNSNASTGSAPATSTAYTVLLSFLISSTGTYSNSGTLYFNCTLVGGQRNTYSGVYIRKDGSDYYLTAYNWDGNADTVEYPITVDEPHVLCVRHLSGTMYLSVDCGAEVSVASGTTTNSTAFFLGDEGTASGTTNDFRGRIGELAVYNTGLSGSDLSAANAYFCNKWLTISALTILGTLNAGAYGTVTSKLTALFNLDGVTRTVSAEKSLVVGGNVAYVEQATPPTAIAGMVLLFAEDDGTGKLRLMAQFPTGAAKQIEIET